MWNRAGCAGDAVRLLESVVDQLSSRPVIERTGYFYDHPDESGNDELHLKDGRV
jgi:hypothetical protein